jgi:hypothetical protein
MSLLEELKHKMNEAKQNYKQNKQNYEDAYNQINKKTDEVERLVEENKKNNTCIQDVLAKIIYAEENYVAAQIEVIEIQNICNAMHKVIAELRHEKEVPIKAMQLAYEKDEMEAHKVLYQAEKEAEQKYKEAEIKLNYIEAQINQIMIDVGKELWKKQLPEAKTALDNAKSILDSASRQRRSCTNHFLTKPFESLNEMRNKMNNDIRICEASSKYTIINIELQVAKKMVSDALQKYKEEKVNFFKAHLIETLSDIEWKRSNFEMVDNMLKQIIVLQACEEKRVEEKQAEEKRVEEKRAEEKRAEEKRAEENRKNFEKVEIMLKQIEVLQNWMNETKIREEKRANAINAFLEERHKF